MRFAVNEPPPHPVSRRGAGGVHRPPDGAVAGRVPLRCDDDRPGVQLGAFTELLLVQHVRAGSGRQPPRGLRRWLRAARAPAIEGRALPGSRALTASGR